MKPIKGRNTGDAAASADRGAVPPQADTTDDAGAGIAATMKSHAPGPAKRRPMKFGKM